jgi:endo-1,4-beta-xylanase
VRLCIAEPRCDGVTTWGFTDAYTWLFPDRPLLFNPTYQPKPAFYGVRDGLMGLP